MSSSILEDPTGSATRRRSRLGIAARFGMFAGAAGVALISVAAASASACPVRAVRADSDDVVATRRVVSDPDDFVGGRLVTWHAHVATHHVTRTRHVTSARVAVRAVSVSQPVVTSGGLGGVWACIRQHESGGNYAINTGNGYYGAYQFSLSTWQSVGGTGLPSNASPAEQDMRAQILQAQAGWGPWPSTSVMCGV